MYGPGHGWGFGLFWQIGAFLGGLVLTAAIVALAILLVRYLIVATRAAQLYVDAHTPGTPGTTPPAATEPPPATPAAPVATSPSTTTAPAADPTPPDVPRTARTRTPKKPPAAL